MNTTNPPLNKSEREADRAVFWVLVAIIAVGVLGYVAYAVTRDNQPGSLESARGVYENPNTLSPSSGNATQPAAVAPSNSGMTNSMSSPSNSAVVPDTTATPPAYTTPSSDPAALSQPPAQTAE
jgi:hypothetical protein